MGNTCYFSAVMQALAACSLTGALEALPAPTPLSQTLLRLLKELSPVPTAWPSLRFEEARTLPWNAYAAEVLDLLGATRPDFKNGGQHDAADVLAHLQNELPSAVAAPTFQVCSGSRFECACGRATEQLAHDGIVRISFPTGATARDRFTAQSRLDALLLPEPDASPCDRRPPEPACAAEARTRTRRWLSTPEVLVLQVQRVEEVGPMQRGVARPVRRVDATLTEGESVCLAGPAPARYDLVAMVQHLAVRSHYICAADVGAGRWLVFDDAAVRPLQNAVASMAETAHLLFYRRRRSS